MASKKHRKKLKYQHRLRKYLELFPNSKMMKDWISHPDQKAFVMGDVPMFGLDLAAGSSQAVALPVSVPNPVNYNDMLDSLRYAAEMIRKSENKPKGIRTYSGFPMRLRIKPIPVHTIYVAANA